MQMTYLSSLKIDARAAQKEPNQTKNQTLIIHSSVHDVGLDVTNLEHLQFSVCYCNWYESDTFFTVFLVFFFFSFTR